MLQHQSGTYNVWAHHHYLDRLQTFHLAQIVLMQPGLSLRHRLALILFLLFMGGFCKYDMQGQLHGSDNENCIHGSFWMSGTLCCKQHINRLSSDGEQIMTRVVNGLSAFTPFPMQDTEVCGDPFAKRCCIKVKGVQL